MRRFGAGLLPRFLFYGVNSHLKAIEEVTGFTTVKHLSSKQILGIEFLIPPLAEQQRIVGILDEAFDGIATAKANAEKNLQNARALFESHLHSTFAQLRHDWPQARLEELLEVQNGYAFSSKDYSESGHFVMRIGNVQNGYISLANPKFIKLPADGSLQRFVLSEDDILVSLTGNVGRVGVIQKEHLPAALNQRVARISIRKGSPASRELLLFFLFSHWFREELTGAGHGTAQQNVSTKDLVEIPIPIPPLPEQQRIVDKFGALSAETQRLQSIYQRKLEVLDELKKSLLHQAFTGQLGAPAA